jgi:hypothetical protein
MISFARPLPQRTPPKYEQVVAWSSPCDDHLRGLLLGLFGFAGFFLVLALLIERAGLVVAFAGAIAATLAIQTVSLVFVLRAPKALSAIVP